MSTMPRRLADYFALTEAHRPPLWVLALAVVVGVAAGVAADAVGAGSVSFIAVLLGGGVVLIALRDRRSSTRRP